MPTYDVAVLGAGIPGLVAAVLLARANRKVVVIDPAALPGGVLASKVVDGVTFAAGPVLTQGFEPGGVFRTLYASIGMPIAAPPGPQTYQVALPDRRITVHADADATLEELRREFSHEIDTVAAMVRDLRSAFTKQRGSRWASFVVRHRSALSFLQNRNLSRELLSYFSVQTRCFFGRTLSQISLSELATLVVHPPMLLPQGFHGLAVQLRDLFTAAGGTYLRSSEWPSLEVGRDRTASLTVDAEQVKPRVSIVNVGWAMERTVFLGIRQQGLPVAMLSYVLGLPSYDRPDDLFMLTVFDDAGSANGSDEMRPLTATFLGPGYAKSDREGLVGDVRTVIPFLEQHVALRGELDLAGRRIPLLERISTVDRGGSRNGSELRTLRTVKRTYQLQDRTHAVIRTIEAARMLAGSLS